MQPAGERPSASAGPSTGRSQERADGVAFARRYAIFGREVETLVGLDRLNEAHSVADVDRAMDQVTWNENVIAADDRGNIGYWHPGLHPLRPQGYDERLPYPGTGEAEWRGSSPRDKRPQVVNPDQGWLAQWNNVPSVGWTDGDAPARERTPAAHRATWVMWNLQRLVRQWPAARACGSRDRPDAGTTAQQRPLFQAGLERARRAASGSAAAVLDELLRWDGSYHRTDSNGTVDPGVAIWEEFKDPGRADLPRRRSAAKRPGRSPAAPARSHEYDITNGESLALRRSRRAARPRPRPRPRRARRAASGPPRSRAGATRG